MTAENIGDAIANLRGHFPPTPGPGIFAGVLFPRFIVSKHRFPRPARHRAKAVTQQMNAGSERGEFFAAAVDGSFKFHVSGFRLSSNLRKHFLQRGGIRF